VVAKGCRSSDSLRGPAGGVGGAATMGNEPRRCGGLGAPRCRDVHARLFPQRSSFHLQPRSSYVFTCYIAGEERIVASVQSGGSLESVTVECIPVGEVRGAVADPSAEGSREVRSTSMS